MESTASITANITVDLNRVRKHDDAVRDFNKISRQITLTAFVFLAGTAALLGFGHYIFGGGAGTITLLLVFIRMRRGGYSDDVLMEVYTEGLLVPAIVRKTNPLTILALGTLSTGTGAPERYGCREIEVSSLPGQNLQPGERVPCVAMYQESSDTSDYWSYYEPHPLCWATDRIGDIRQNESSIDTKEWEALANLAQSLPDKNLKSMYILDGQFNHIASRSHHNLESSEELVATDSLYAQYQKKYDNIAVIGDDIPHADIYRKLLALSVKHQVYEYLFQLDSDNDPRYITYVCDPAAFMEKMDKFEGQLAEDEAPIIANDFLVTTRGIWRKGEFTPWKDVEVKVEVHPNNLIITSMNGKDLADFDGVFAYYGLDPARMKNEIKTLRILEESRLNSFWLDVKNGL